ncbi:hypothetical protein ACJX0J_039171, partial [Zea mays]
GVLNLSLILFLVNLVSFYFRLGQAFHKRCALKHYFLFIGNNIGVLPPSDDDTAAVFFTAVGGVGALDILYPVKINNATRGHYYYALGDALNLYVRVFPIMSSFSIFLSGAL